MRPHALRLIGFLVLGLALAGCDKCGNPIEINKPYIPGACYSQSQPR